MVGCALWGVSLRLVGGPARPLNLPERVAQSCRWIRGLSRLEAYGDSREFCLENGALFAFRRIWSTVASGVAFRASLPDSDAPVLDLTPELVLLRTRSNFRH